MTSNQNRVRVLRAIIATAILLILVASSGVLLALRNIAAALPALYPQAEGRLMSTKDGDTFVFWNTPLEVVASDYNRYGLTPPLTIQGEAARNTKVKGFFSPNDPGPLLDYLIASADIYVFNGRDIGSKLDLPKR